MTKSIGQWANSYVRSARRAYYGFVQAVFGVPSARLPNGRAIYVDLTDRRGRALLRGGGSLNPESHQMWSLLMKRRPWTVVVDVGANYGEFLLTPNLPGGARLVAVEPNARLLPFLGRGLAESGLSVELLDVALSDRTGTASLSVDRNWSGKSSLRTAIGNASTVTVPTLTLAAVLDASEPLEKQSLLLKVDVEGHELAVLRGGLGSISRLQDFAAMIEVAHLPRADFEDLLEHFSITVMERQSGDLVPLSSDLLARRGKTNEIYWQDAVLTRKENSALLT